MKLPNSIYITGPKENFDNLSWVHKLHENGVGGIILSLEEASFYENHPEEHFLAYFHEKGEQMKMICEALEIVLLVSDNIQVAHFSNADGIHFSTGNDDLPSIKKENPSLVVGMEITDLDQVNAHDADLIDFFMLSDKKTDAADVADLKISLYLKDEESGLWQLNAVSDKG